MAAPRTRPAPTIEEMREVYRRFKREGNLDFVKDDPLLVEAVFQAEMRGGLFKGELPYLKQVERDKALDSPSYFATKVLDPWYEEHFERQHYVLLDEVLAPYLLGETVKIDGVTYDPRQYTGLGVLWSRSTIKSTMLRIIILWCHLYRKLRGTPQADGSRKKEDARTMFVHQDRKKAIVHGEALKEIARNHKLFRQLFPEFRAPAGKQWDTQDSWRWGCFSTYQANEYSFTFYGEESAKTGGHYTERLVDDWVTDESVTTPEQLDSAEHRFRQMDNLRDRTRAYNPWLLAGTHYHYQDTYKRLEKAGGWLFWKQPAHVGSPKAIFDLLKYDERDEKDRVKIEAGLVALEKTRAEDLRFPKLLPWRELYRSARAEGQYIYVTQLLLDPVPEGEQRFDGEDVDAMWCTEIPAPEECWGYLRCDPAISKKKDRDETAMHLVLVRWDGHRYFVDGWVGREKRPTEQVRKMFGLVRRWQGMGYRVKEIGVESVAYQEALAQLCRDGVPEREALTHGELIPVQKAPCSVRSITRSAELRKQERILEMEGPVSRREAHIWTENPIGARTVTQLKNFPFDRDDILDAMHDAWEGVMVPSRPMGAKVIRIHPAFRKAMRRWTREDGPRVEDTSNTVTLSAWR